ncbi:MAG: ribonuclease III [Anaerolineales bacterium]
MSREATSQPGSESLRERMGLEFQDPSLAIRALTHRSFANEHPGKWEDNERLEFLGDAVLDFVSGAWVYHRFPDSPEGRLTRLRSALVRTETLAGFARKLDIGSLLRLGRGEEETGGRDRPANLCGAFEALIGALYLDQGAEAARRFVEPLFEEAAERILEEQGEIDAKSLLQEWSQAERSLTPRYVTAEERGPDHEREFTVEVYLGDELWGAGIGPSKQAAAQAAALEALGHIRKAS